MKALAAAAAAALRILVFGDSGTGEADQHQVGRHMAQECARRGGCDFGLVLGDNLYGGAVEPAREGDGRTVFDDKFAARLDAPYEALGAAELWAVAGNHDWTSSESVDLQIAYTRHSARWRMPGYDYAVPDLPDWVRIYGIDTPRLLSGTDSTQVQRAAEWLCGGAGWRILFAHHPVYTSGWHANAAGEYVKAKRPLLAPLIERCGIQFFLAGHDHDQEHISAPGFEQIVQGAAGRLRKLKRIGERASGVEQLAGAARYGFALLELTAEHAELRFFGYSDLVPYGNWHCRRYELADFADRERRSRSCALDER